MLEERGEFAGEGEALALLKIVERLFAEAVARAEEALPRAVVDDEGPHPVQPLGETFAPLAVAVEQHLGVAMIGDELAAARLQLGAECGVVVDLAVEGDAKLAVARPHRLRAAAEIDDGEAAMPEKNARTFLRPMPLRIRPAMRDGAGHPAQHAEVAVAREARYAAHRRWALIFTSLRDFAWPARGTRSSPDSRKKCA